MEGNPAPGRSKDGHVVTDSLIRYDGMELMLVSRDKGGKPHLCMCVEEDENTVTYLYVLISESQKWGVEFEDADIRSIYTQSKQVTVATTTWNETTREWEEATSVTTGKDLPDKWLPASNTGLGKRKGRSII